MRSRVTESLQCFLASDGVIISQCYEEKEITIYRALQWARRLNES